MCILHDQVTWPARASSPSHEALLQAVANSLADAATGVYVQAHHLADLLVAFHGLAVLHSLQAAVAELAAGTADSANPDVADALRWHAQCLDQVWQPTLQTTFQSVRSLTMVQLLGLLELRAALAAFPGQCQAWFTEDRTYFLQVRVPQPFRVRRSPATSRAPDLDLVACPPDVQQGVLGLVGAAVQANAMRSACAPVKLVDVTDMASLCSALGDIDPGLYGKWFADMTPAWMRRPDATWPKDWQTHVVPAFWPWALSDPVSALSTRAAAADPVFGTHLFLAVALALNDNPPTGSPESTVLSAHAMMASACATWGKKDSLLPVAGTPPVASEIAGVLRALGAFLLWPWLHAAGPHPLPPLLPVEWATANLASAAPASGSVAPAVQVQDPFAVVQATAGLLHVHALAVTWLGPYRDLTKADSPVGTLQPQTRAGPEALLPLLLANVTQPCLQHVAATAGLAALQDLQRALLTAMHAWQSAVQTVALPPTGPTPGPPGGLVPALVRALLPQPLEPATDTALRHAENGDPLPASQLPWLLDQVVELRPLQAWYQAKWHTKGLAMGALLALRTPACSDVVDVIRHVQPLPAGAPAAGAPAAGAPAAGAPAAGAPALPREDVVYWEASADSSAAAGAPNVWMTLQDLRAGLDSAVAAGRMLCLGEAQVRVAARMLTAVDAFVSTQRTWGVMVPLADTPLARDVYQISGRESDGKLTPDQFLWLQAVSPKAADEYRRNIGTLATVLDTLDADLQARGVTLQLKPGLITAGGVDANGWPWRDALFRYLLQVQRKLDGHTSEGVSPLDRVLFQWDDSAPAVTDNDREMLRWVLSTPVPHSVRRQAMVEIDMLAQLWNQRVSEAVQLQTYEELKTAEADDTVLATCEKKSSATTAKDDMTRELQSKQQSGDKALQECILAEKRALAFKMFERRLRSSPEWPSLLRLRLQLVAFTDTPGIPRDILNSLLETMRKTYMENTGASLASAFQGTRDTGGVATLARAAGSYHLRFQDNCTPAQKDKLLWQVGWPALTTTSMRNADALATLLVNHAYVMTDDARRASVLATWVLVEGRRAARGMDGATDLSAIPKDQATKAIRSLCIEMPKAALLVGLARDVFPESADPTPTLMLADAGLLRALASVTEPFLDGAKFVKWVLQFQVSTAMVVRPKQQDAASQAVEAPTSVPVGAAQRELSYIARVPYNIESFLSGERAKVRNLDTVRRFADGVEFYLSTKWIRDAFDDWCTKDNATKPADGTAATAGAGTGAGTGTGTGAGAGAGASDDSTADATLAAIARERDQIQRGWEKSVQPKVDNVFWPKRIKDMFLKLKPLFKEPVVTMLVMPTPEEADRARAWLDAKPVDVTRNPFEDKPAEEAPAVAAAAVSKTAKFGFKLPMAPPAASAKMEDDEAVEHFSAKLRRKLPAQAVEHQMRAGGYEKLIDRVLASASMGGVHVRTRWRRYWGSA